MNRACAFCAPLARTNKMRAKHGPHLRVDLGGPEGIRTPDLLNAIPARPFQSMPHRLVEVPFTQGPSPSSCYHVP